MNLYTCLMHWATTEFFMDRQQASLAGPCLLRHEVIIYCNIIKKKKKKEWGKSWKKDRLLDNMIRLLDDLLWYAVCVSSGPMK